MGFNRILHNIAIAEDAGHAVSLKLKDERFFPCCRIESIKNTTITIIHKPKGQRLPKKTSIKISDIIDITQIKESDAA